MKKFILLCFLLIVLLTACSASEEVADVPEQETDIVIDTEEEKDIAPEPVAFYQDIMAMDTRPLAVMIDNDGSSSRPHAGLEKAYLLYEVIVEGGSTRIMALFNDYDIAQVGPVRSSRHYFLDFAMENNAVYCHYGWSPKAQSDISSYGINNINGLYDTCFWRDNTYDNTYHNAYTSTSALWETAQKKGYPTEGNGTPFSYHPVMTMPEGGTDAQTLAIDYSGFYRVGYVYDAEKEAYTRLINKANHPTWSGDTLYATNIIAIRVTNTNLNDGENKGRQELYDVGSGKGWYLTGGKVYDITWTKDTRTAHSVYAFADTGEEITLNPGTTWIQVVGNDMNVTIE